MELTMSYGSVCILGKVVLLASSVVFIFLSELGRQYISVYLIGCSVGSCLR